MNVSDPLKYEVNVALLLASAPNCVMRLVAAVPEEETSTTYRRTPVGQVLNGVVSMESVEDPEAKTIRIGEYKAELLRCENNWP